MKTGLGSELQIYAKPLLLALGMSCYWVWFISGLFSTSVWYGVDRTSWPLVLLSNAAMLLALCALARRAAPFVQRFPVVVGAGLVTSAGIVLATLGFNVDACAFMIVPGGLLTGVGSAPLILFWREVSEPLSSKRVERVLVAASVLFAMFLYLFFITLPFAVALVICSAAPVASALLLRAAYFAKPSGRSSVQEVGDGGDEVVGESTGDFGAGRSGQSGGAARSFGALLACCGTLAAFQGVFKTAPPSGISDIAWPLAVSCALLATGVVIAADFALAKWAPERLASKLLLPFSVIACALAACADAGGSISGAAMFASYFLFLVYTFSELDSVASALFSGVQVLALGLCAVDVGFLAGMGIGSLFSGSAALAPGAALAVLCALAVVARTRCSDEADRFAGRSDEGSFADRAESALDGGGDSMAQSIGRRSAAVARAFALSEREEEILAHLACGKTAKTIAADTYISYNTVKTHISHIYQKTDVHTREELIALVMRQGDREIGPS